MANSTSRIDARASRAPVSGKRAPKKVKPAAIPASAEAAPVPAKKKAPAAKAVRGKAKAAGTAAPKKTPRAAAGVSGNGRSLVIVESPTKSRTLSKFLGRGFTVLASNGHIMDLPKSKLGVDIDNDFEPQYEPIPSKNAALAKLRAAANEVDRIFLAPDPDREGEAIAWHLAGALKATKRPLLRLTFNEITERAVKAALEQPRELDMNLVNAQQARRVLDRLVGYKVSPVLWKSMYFGLSAGRVQTVALRLLCEREDEIDAFVAVEYWTIEVDYETAAGERFTARLHRVGDDALESGQLRGDDAGARAAALAEELERGQARVASVQTSPKQVHPRAPFITSTLQQTAFNRLGFTSQRTMKVAQQLYEGVALGSEGSVGLITYMRTDSPRLAGEAITAMRGWIEQNLGADYLPEQPRNYKGKKSAQDAHEAIRPSYVERTPDSVRRFLTEEQNKLYELIWTRAMASQVASAEYLATTVEIESGRLGLRATGRILKFPGFQKLYGFDEDDEEKDGRLPELKESEPLTVAKEAVTRAPSKTYAQDAEAYERSLEPEKPVRADQHFTQPPPRYSEASLVKALEEENIGRPSTYATIVSTITARQYVVRDRGRLIPTDLGRTVIKLLVSEFPDVFDVKFTANMEDELDGIEEGAQEWRTVVRDLWNPLSRDLARAEKNVKRLRAMVEEPTDIVCPQSGHKMIKKWGRRGAFLACPGWPECKYTRPVDDEDLPVPTEGVCELCGAGLVIRNGPYGRYISCVRRPECKYVKKLTLGIQCPECKLGELMEKRTGKNAKRPGKVFYSCSRYPDCTFLVWDKPVDKPCPNCQAPFLVEKETKKGVTLRCLNCKMTFQPEAVGA